MGQLVADSNQAVDTEPVFTPDGRTLWWLAMDRPGYEADRTHFEIMDWPSARPSPGHHVPDDRTGPPAGPEPYGIEVHPEQKSAYFTAGCLGQNPVFGLDLKTNKVTRLLASGRVTDVGLLKGLLIGMQHLQSPTELYTLSADGKDLKPITGFNGARLAETQMGQPEQFSLGSERRDGLRLCRQALRLDARSGGVREWQVAFLVHGGPQGSFGNDFHYRWNPQAYVGAGLTTVAVDFHG